MSDSVQSQLHQKRLESLRSNMDGAFADKRRQELIEHLQLLIENALFLKNDKKRRQKWLHVLEELDDKFLEQLSAAIIRENLRYKKRDRDIVVELNQKTPANSYQQK